MSKGVWTREAVFLGAVIVVLGLFAVFIHTHAGAAQGAAWASIGATLGVVYTAGGLTIVAVAVFSLTLLPRTVEHYVNEQWSDMRGKLQEEMKNLVRASNLFMRAQWGEGNLQRAEDLIRRALSIYEPLAGARIWLAKEYHHDARTRFRQVHAPDMISYNAPVPDVSWTVAQGIHWLQEARRAHDSAPVEIVAMESELHAMRGTAATASVRSLLREFKRLKESHTEEVHIDPVVVLHAFNDSEALIRELEKLLGLRMLLEAAEVERRLQEYADGVTREVQFLAVPRPGRLPSAPVITPCKIWFNRSDAGLWAEWPYVRDGSMAFEMFPRSPDKPGHAQPIGVRDMVNELTQRFWLLTGRWPDATTYRDEPVTPVIHEVTIPDADDYYGRW